MNNARIARVLIAFTCAFFHVGLCAEDQIILERLDAFRKKLSPDDVVPRKGRLDADGDPLLPGVSRQLGTRRFRLSGRIGALAFHPDGKRLLGGGAELVYWDIETGKRLEKLKREDNHFTTYLAFQKEGRLLIDGFCKGTQLLDAHTGEALATGVDEEFVAAPRGFVFSPDGKTYVAPMEDYRYGVYDAASRKLILTIKLDETVKNDQPPIAISPDGQWLAMAPTRHAVRIWNLRTGEEKAQPEGHGAEPDSLAFVGSFGQLVSGDSAGFVLLWNMERGEVIRIRRPLNCGIVNMCVSADGRSLYTYSGRSEESIITDMITGLDIARFEGRRSLFQPLYAKDGRLFGLTSSRREVKCMAPRSAEELFSTFLDDSYSVDLSPDEKVLVVARRRSSLARLDAKDGKELQGFENPSHDDMYSAVFASGGRSVFALGEEGALLVFDAKTLELRKRRVDSDLSAVHLIPTRTADERLVLASGSGQINLIEAASGTIFARLKSENEEDMQTAVLAPDGHTLVTGHVNTTIRIWDLRDGLGAVTPRAKPFMPSDLDQLWEGLGDAEGRIAYESMVLLRSQPFAALTLLRERLHPAEFNAETVQACIKRLDSEDFAERNRASDELQAMGEAVRPLLEKVVDEKSVRPSVEALERIGWVLKRTDSPVTASPETLRHIRSVMLLEWIRSNDSCDLLRKLAEGHPDARLTREVQAALARLEKSTPSPNEPQK